MANRITVVPTFTEAEIPHGRSGSTNKGAGVWQTLALDFEESGIVSAKVNIGEHDFKQAYASLAHAIKTLGLQTKIRAVRRKETGSVYLQRIPVNGNGNGNGHGVEPVAPTQQIPQEPTVPVEQQVSQEPAAVTQLPQETPDTPSQTIAC
jgi:hypothetical protein